MFDYPNRIYCFIRNTPLNIIQSLGQELYRHNKDSRNDGRYTLLMIDSNKLRNNNYEFYYDPNFEYGVFTEQSIPNNFIYIQGKINYKKN